MASRRPAPGFQKLSSSPGLRSALGKDHWHFPGQHTLRQSNLWTELEEVLSSSYETYSWGFKRQTPDRHLPTSQWDVPLSRTVCPHAIRGTEERASALRGWLPLLNPASHCHVHELCRLFPWHLQSFTKTWCCACSTIFQGNLAQHCRVLAVLNSLVKIYWQGLLAMW